MGTSTSGAPSPVQRADGLQTPKASRADEGRPAPRWGLSAPLACYASQHAPGPICLLVVPPEAAAFGKVARIKLADRVLQRLLLEWDMDDPACTVANPNAQRVWPI